MDRLITAISEESFQAWYHEQTFADNIRQGNEYFNGPGRITRPRKHTPSSLLQCSRKIAYRQQNTPEEEPPPNGLFWIGEQFEDAVALPYLENAVIDDNEYVTNSLWVNFEVETDAGALTIKGSTDPVIVDDNAVPVVPTEIKTKRSVTGLSKPNRHHKAQLHAYMRGLSLKHKRGINHGVLLYGSRTHLDVKAFPVRFDRDFWEEEVINWAENHTQYRLDNQLPAADPEYSWECDVCDYRERCGKGSRLYKDTGPTGLLPLFVHPRRQVIEYLESYDARLTPTLAHHYPQLVDEYGVSQWWCNGMWNSLQVGCSRLGW